MIWTDDQLAELRCCIDNKYSGGRTAQLMGMTLGQVVGMAFRKGWRFNSQEPSRRLKIGGDRGWRPMKKEPEPVDSSPPEFLNIPFDDIAPHQCRYPSEQSIMLYCGQPSGDRSWCPYHQTIVFERRSR